MAKGHYAWAAVLCAGIAIASCRHVDRADNTCDDVTSRHAVLEAALTAMRRHNLDREQFLLDEKAGSVVWHWMVTHDLSGFLNRYPDVAEIVARRHFSVISMLPKAAEDSIPFDQRTGLIFVDLAIPGESAIAY